MTTIKNHFSLDDFTVSIVIPCLNESETIALCVEEAFKGLISAGVIGEVLIADNGSVDGSQEIAKQLGARVVTIKEKGYGAALNGGIHAANGTVIVFGDADMSYPFSAVRELLAPLREGKSEFVLGSRLDGNIQKGAMPFLNRYFGTPVLTFLIRFIYRLPVTDCNSGMRAFFKTIYPKLNLQCPGMEYASEMLIQVARKNITYSEVPINFRKDLRTRPPHLKRWRDGWRHLRFILGNAPSLALIVLPGSIGGVFLLIALILSFGRVLDPNGDLHFHTALSLIALATPLLLMTITFLLVRIAASESRVRQSGLVALMLKYSDNSTLFFTSVLFFGIMLIQIILMFGKWWLSGFGKLDEIDSAIRVMVYGIIGTTFFCMDIGLGLLKLISYHTTGESE